jgi:hypothetical protein
MLMKSAANLVAMFENDDEEEKGERRQRAEQVKNLMSCFDLTITKRRYLFVGFFI